MKLSGKYLDKLWDASLSKETIRFIDRLSLEYQEVDQYAEENLIQSINSEIDRKIFEVAGPHRLPVWESGWGENYEEYKNSNDVSHLIPKYFSKYKVNRLCQKFIVAESFNFEINILRALQHWIFSSYLMESQVIYEFGCGTGHNLLFLNEILPGRKIVGLDWSNSSQRILELVSQRNPKIKLEWNRFDYFSQENELEIEPEASFVTVASLEQIGDSFTSFVNFVLLNKPKIVIHIEPFPDLLDPMNPVDVTSLRYMRLRNYIEGYFQYLKSLENQGRVRIITFRRSFVGSKYVDGYTLLIWQVLN